MVYTTEYASPLGPITLACDGEAIIGLWFNGPAVRGREALAGCVLLRT